MVEHPSEHGCDIRPKKPRDREHYDQSPESVPLHSDLGDGTYVFVLDIDRCIRVLRAGPHRHPKILGGAKPTRYAGDFTLEAGRVIELTNLSGAFRFSCDAGLLTVAEIILDLGVPIAENAIRFFPPNGDRPLVLSLSGGRDD